MSTAIANNKFSWLLKREYWEYRGAFVWAPAITGAIMLAFVLFGLVVAEVTANRSGVRLEGINFNEISARLTEGNVAKVHAGLDVGLLMLGAPISGVLFFVLFAYGIGALFNDRADRSVLFWKSLPISDVETVLAKVTAMAFIAPVLATLALIALQVAFLVVVSLWVLMHGVNPWLLWSPAHLVGLWLRLIMLIPVNALWALPTIGWLLLVSSYVRSKPFLWALAVPVVAGVVTSMFHIMSSLSLPSGWFWKNIVGRLLFSIVPGTWLDVVDLRGLEHDDQLPEALANMFSFSSVAHLFATPTFLIGIAAGVAMIAAAVYFRRQRTESYA